MSRNIPQRLRQSALILFLLCFLAPTANAQRMLEPGEYLKDPKFKPLYLKALGPKAKTPWLAKMDGPAPTTTKVKVDGTEYVLAAFCKNHDCGDNNAVLLYLGEKGIGRLSAMRLGERLRVETARQDDKRINVLDIDWSLFNDLDARLGGADLRGGLGPGGLGSGAGRFKGLGCVQALAPLEKSRSLGGSSSLARSMPGRGWKLARFSVPKDSDAIGQ